MQNLTSQIFYKLVHDLGCVAQQVGWPVAHKVLNSAYRV